MQVNLCFSDSKVRTMQSAQSAFIVKLVTDWLFLPYHYWPLFFRTSLVPTLCDCLQATLEAAGTGVRSIVIRLPAFVWGNGGSCFIPAQLEAAKKQGKAYYLLPG